MPRTRALTTCLILSALAGPLAAQAPDTLSLFDARDIRAAAPGRLPLDPNGFLFNPRWLGSDSVPDIEARCRFRVAHGHLDFRALVTTRPGCLSPAERATVTLAEASGALFLGAACATSSQTGNVRGHVNIVPATITGQLRWVGYSRTPGDRDFTLDVVARTPGASNAHNSTYGRGRAYHIEFYRDETFRRLEGTGGPSWWHAIDHDRHDTERMSGLVDGRFAIVTGLFGLDGVHGFHSELHPVYAMFVLQSAVRQARGWDEEWAVMVRNVGNEGDCSLGRMAMVIPPDDPAGPASGGLQDYTVDLGWWDAATGATVEFTPGWVDAEHLAAWKAHPGNAPAFLADRAGRHLYVGFRHQRPTVGGPDFLYLGGLKVHWTGSAAGSPVDRLVPWLPEVCTAPPPPGPVGRGRGVFSPSWTGCLRVSLEPVKGAGGPTIEGSKGASKPGARALDLVNGIDTLKPLPAGPLGSLAARWRPAAVFAPQPAIGWLDRRNLVDFCNSVSDRRDPLCRGTWRWVVAYGLSGNAGKWESSPLGGLQVREHSLGVPVLDAFSYRFAWRRDHFIRRGAGTRAERLTPGWSVRVAPILAPNSLALFSNVSVTPYTLVSPGLSHVADHPLQFTFGYGAGMHLQLGTQEAFVEYQLYSRKGGYEFAHGFTLGLILSSPFFH